MRATPDHIDLVIHHGDCPDGSAAAHAVRMRHPHVEVFPANYHEPPPDVAGRHVAVVDFAYPLEVTQRMVASAASIIILDHHDTAREALENLPEAIFDMTHSGVMVTWDFFHPGEEPPWLFPYIEDRDLDRWVLPNSREIGAFFQLHAPFTPESIAKLLETPKEQVLREGAVAKRTVDAYCLATRKFSSSISFFGHRARICNSTRWGVSELATALMDDEHPIGIVWFLDHTNVVRMSFRSREDIHVGHLAKRLGGGGHPQSAGCEVPMNVLIDVLEGRHG